MNSFFANLYELLYYDPNFSTAVFSNGAYSAIGLATIIIPFIIAFIYYKVIDRPALASITVWILAGLLSAFLSFLVSYSLVYTSLAELYQFNTSQYSTLSGISATFSFVLHLFYSFVFKRISINTKNIPF
ncbi:MULTISPECIES: hypothetical protein [unclassified Kaistella]|uniref:hypothetical protein n=1 Tax=unclassified Kaistella TaxID=2762626 RepID=UPI0027336A94|nr:MULTISPECIES: hypothetical protein [unclassified Kaistella]MDP2455140.1 hypothetical protein [Kaistella sp. SH11-4b]MDP2458047.1 hypothetical protein [Kaistella sp. SH40-3]MDP2461014.1 hypothetical protein [Kaistella sp. SH19-2b]